MSVQLIVALISATVALVSIGVSTFNTRSNVKNQKDLALLQGQLQDDQEQRREKASTASHLKEVISLYQNPLLSAAFELQNRLYNIAKGNLETYLRSNDQEEQSYAVNSTLFLIAQYLAWAEALREGIQFLDLGDLKRNQNLVKYLETIRSTLSTDKRFDPLFRIFSVDQRAIGELMLQEATLGGHSTDIRWHCTGYVSFCHKLKRDKRFSPWFAGLDHDVRQLTTNIERAPARLVALQNHLVDLINFLDGNHVCFPKDKLSKIDQHYMPTAPRA